MADLNQQQFPKATLKVAEDRVLPRSLSPNQRPVGVQAIHAVHQEDEPRPIGFVTGRSTARAVTGRTDLWDSYARTGTNLEVGHTSRQAAVQRVQQRHADQKANLARIAAEQRERG